MDFLKIFNKIKALIFCCGEEDSNEAYLASPNYAKLASTSRGSASTNHSARTHLTPRASAASHHTHRSSIASSASRSSIYHTASQGRSSGQRISRQSSSGCRSSEQYSFGNISPLSLSRVSSTASAARKGDAILAAWTSDSSLHL
jgi:hypothetical protein